MTLNKSSSLPAILALGTTAPKLAGHEKQQSLRYATANDKKSAFATFKPADVSQQVLEYVMELQRPGWRQRATPEPEELPVTVEDLVPKNQRYPRVTPAWLKHEKQVLRFYAFFQETVTERADENSRKRHIIIMYYLEDGTVSMSEPRIENSGIVQGSFLKRQRVSRNDGTGFIGPEDLRCGIQITLFGRTYHITGCDSFTRWYYREIGVEIGENEEVQEDAWQKSYKLRKLIDRGALPPSRFSVEQKTIGQFQMGAPPVSKKLTQFLLNDRRVLRFKGYWDDHTKYGARLYFNIHYYLADNTMEFNEAHCRNSGRYPAPVFFKRGPLRKHNVAHCVPAMLTDESCVYLPEDLRVGDSIDVWGRKVVLFDCDAFTQKFYKEYLDLDQRQNRLDVSEKPVTHLKLTPPPHNGVGKEEDSLISTQMINVKAPKVDLEKLMVYTGEVLRFEAKMANGLAEELVRKAGDEASQSREASAGFGGFQQKIGTGKKVRILGLHGEEHQKYNGKNGAIMAFDPATGRYSVKVVVLSDKSVGLQSEGATILLLKHDNVELHPDQIERDQVGNGDEIVLLGAGEAKRKLYEVRLDPQYWYDKAIERVLEAKNDFEVLDLTPQFIPDMGVLKKAYRKISLAVHPDKNKHPQAADAFRKVYGAFETLMDLRQQRRLLWILGKLTPDMEEQVIFDEEEEDELFQWWWEATVPEIEKQVAEFEGQQFDEYGAMWISDGLGGDVGEVKWIGLETAKRLHRDEEGVIFIDVRDRRDFVAGHIADAYCTPLPEIIDFGLVNVFMSADDQLIHKLLKHRTKPIIVYSEVATPFSRCRAFCRWLLRAGHQTIKVERVRRLRGGIFGWKHKDGPVARPLQDTSYELMDADSNASSFAASLIFQGVLAD